MNFRTPTILTLLLLGVLFNSCTVKKRTYQKGYYVDWAFKKQCKKPIQDDHQTNIATHEKDNIPNDKRLNNEFFTANTSKNESEQFAQKNKALLNLQDTCGDIMLFKNGDELKVKVLEVNEQSIIYKRCDNYNGPSYSIGKEKIHSITYTNGFKEIIEPPPAKKIEIIKNEDKEYPSELIFATILPIVLFGIGSLIAFNSALKAKKKILANPDKYKGLNLAKFMITFDVLTFIIIGAFMIEFIALLAVGATSSLFIVVPILICAASFIGIIIAAFYYGFHK